MYYLGKLFYLHRIDITLIMEFIIAYEFGIYLGPFGYSWKLKIENIVTK